jgi:hypothetical protein
MLEPVWFHHFQLHCTKNFPNNLGHVWQSSKSKNWVQIHCEAAPTWIWDPTITEKSVLQSSMMNPLGRPNSQPITAQQQSTSGSSFSFVSLTSWVHRLRLLRRRQSTGGIGAGGASATHHGNPRRGRGTSSGVAEAHAAGGSHGQGGATREGLAWRGPARSGAGMARGPRQPEWPREHSTQSRGENDRKKITTLYLL